MTRFCTILAMMVALLAIDPAQAQTKLVGDWQIQPVRLGAAKEFTGCIGVRRSTGPLAFGLAYDIDDAWHVTVHSIGPNRWPNAKVVDVSWQFGTKARRDETATVSQGSLMFELGDNAEASRELQGATFVDLYIGAETFRLPLPQLDAVVREMRDCVRAGKSGGAVAKPADQQKTGTSDARTYVGNWAVVLYREDGGQFRSCSMSQKVGAGGTHAFYLSNDGNWAMTYVDDGGSKAPGRKFEFRYSVDGRPERRGAGEQLSEKLAVFDIDNTPAAIGELRTGRQLVVQSNGERIQFSLDGAGPAIAAVENCFKSSTGVAPPSQPPAPPPRPAPLPTETPSSQR